MTLLNTTASQILVKQPYDSSLYSMDFSNLLGVGETISNIDSATSDPVGLTITGQTVVGNFVTMQIAGGTHGINYRVEVRITTSTGQKYEGDGILKVRDN